MLSAPERLAPSTARLVVTIVTVVTVGRQALDPTQSQDQKYRWQRYRLGTRARCWLQIVIAKCPEGLPYSRMDGLRPQSQPNVFHLPFQLLRSVVLRRTGSISHPTNMKTLSDYHQYDSATELVCTPCLSKPCVTTDILRHTVPTVTVFKR